MEGIKDLQVFLFMSTLSVNWDVAGPRQEREGKRGFVSGYC